MEQIRVYGINIDDIELENINDLTDESWKTLAESFGLVWSLSGFQNQFNDDLIDSNSIFIRFI